MSAALDLFGAPAVAGLALGEAFVTAIEEAQLIARIDAADLSPFRFQQWTGKRLTRSFGWTYDFEKGSFAPADPIPSWLAGVRDRAARFAGLDPAALVQALVIRYDPARASAGTRTGRSSSMSSACRWAVRRRCVCAAAPTRVSRAGRCRWRRARSIISPAKFVATGNTAWRRLRCRAGRSRSAVSRGNEGERGLSRPPKAPTIR